MNIYNSLYITLYMIYIYTCVSMYIHVLVYKHNECECINSQPFMPVHPCPSIHPHLSIHIHPSIPVHPFVSSHPHPSFPFHPSHSILRQKRTEHVTWNTQRTEPRRLLQIKQQLLLRRKLKRLLQARSASAFIWMQKLLPLSRSIAIWGVSRFELKFEPFCYKVLL